MRMKFSGKTRLIMRYTYGGRNRRWFRCMVGCFGHSYWKCRLVLDIDLRLHDINMWSETKTLSMVRCYRDGRSRGSPCCGWRCIPGRQRGLR